MRKQLLFGAALAVAALGIWRSVPVHAQNNPFLRWVTFADIAGSNAAVTLGSGQYRMCQLVAPTGNSNVIRWGDSNTGTSRGALIAAGGGMLLPVPAQGSPFYIDLGATYVYISTGDKLTLTCAQ